MSNNESPANLSDDSKSAGITRLEIALVLILLTLGFILRAWRLSEVGLDHYDEGVYVFSALGMTDSSQPLRLSAEQINHSPPVYFGLVGLAYLLFGGPSDTAAIFVNVLLGTLTIPVVWWMGRTWFGRPAGIAAAALLAFSEFHIVLSRCALTDVAFAFFFLLALAAIVSALKHQSILTAILAGLMVGLAWNTKYHGWFALMISGAALFLFTWRQKGTDVSRSRYFLLWIIIALVAAACYLPWALYVQSQPGGYAALAKHQRTWLRLHWFSNLARQVRMQYYLEGTLSRLSVLAGFLCALVVSGGRLRRATLFLPILGLLLISALLFGGSGTAVLLVILAMPALLGRPVALQRWLILIWLAVWFLSTPLYNPFARLLLPFTAATYLVSGFWMSKFLDESQAEVRTIGRRCALIAAAMVIVLVVSAFLPDPSNPWRQSKSVAEAAQAMEELIPAGSRVVVVGEPTLAYYLHLADRPAFETSHDTTDRFKEVEQLQSPVYVVTGVYTDCSPDLQACMKKLGKRLTLLGTFSMHPKDLRVLDDFLPGDARRYVEDPDNTYDLRLYLCSP
jgi:4-amino-4-deoxy-L-arabinose transferase-like glycosyltransferase